MKRCALGTMPFLLLLGAATLWASEGVQDVIRLEKAKVSNEVQLAFVQNSKTPFDPTAAEIEELEHAGVSATVIVAMIERGNVLKKENQTTQDATNPVAAAATDPAPRDVPRFPYPPGSAVERTTTYADETTEEAAVLYAPPSRELNLSYFYGSLAPYGSWHQSAGHGYSFRPSVALSVNSWRPYSNSGHWVWTDHGWYWESDYPWGWAAFHYGRWHEDTDLGWVWSPDTVWGPAWVNWRYSDSYYGWAPLPPEARYETSFGFSFRDRHVGFDFNFGLNERAYTFVPSNSFLVGEISTVVVSRSQVTKIYNNTTINNTYVYNDNRIINQGVPVQAVASRTNTRIEAIQVTDMQVAEGRTFARAEVRDQKHIKVYRPAFRNETPLEPKQAAAQFQTRMQAAVEHSPGKSRDRAVTGGTSNTGAAAQGRAGPSRVTAQSESQARQRLEFEKSQRGKTGNGDNRDDAHSGKVDRAGDGNSGQGDDLHKPAWGQKGGKGNADDTTAGKRVQEEKAKRGESESNAKAQQPRAEEQKRSQDAAQRGSEVKASHEEETQAKAQLQAEKQKRNQDVEQSGAEEKARRKLDDEKVKVKGKGDKEHEAEALPPDGDKERSSEPQPKGHGKKDR